MRRRSSGGEVIRVTISMTADQLAAIDTRAKAAREARSAYLVRRALEGPCISEHQREELAERLAGAARDAVEGL